MKTKGGVSGDYSERDTSNHKRLFTGVLYNVKAGAFRNYNISKREWVLDGEYVLYANCDMIKQTLDYDFAQEKAFDYSTLSHNRHTFWAF